MTTHGIYSQFVESEDGFAGRCEGKTLYLTPGFGCYVHRGGKECALLNNWNIACNCDQLRENTRQSASGAPFAGELIWQERCR